jgi:hypothetical protein
VEEHRAEDTESEEIRPARRAACQDSRMHILQSPTAVRVITGLMAKAGGSFTAQRPGRERKEAVAHAPTRRLCPEPTSSNADARRSS